MVPSGVCCGCRGRQRGTLYVCSGCPLALCPACALRPATGLLEPFLCHTCLRRGLPPSQAAFSGEWGRLTTGAVALMASAERSSTVMTYTRALRHYTEFCISRSLAPRDCLPSSPALVAAYVFHCLHDLQLSSRTIENRVAALQFWHRRRAHQCDLIGAPPPIKPLRRSAGASPPRHCSSAPLLPSERTLAHHQVRVFFFVSSWFRHSSAGGIASALGSSSSYLGLSTTLRGSTSPHHLHCSLRSSGLPLLF